MYNIQSHVSLHTWTWTRVNMKLNELHYSATTPIRRQGKKPKGCDGLYKAVHDALRRPKLSLGLECVCCCQSSHVGVRRLFKVTSLLWLDTSVQITRLLVAWRMRRLARAVLTGKLKARGFLLCRKSFSIVHNKEQELCRSWDVYSACWKDRITPVFWSAIFNIFTFPKQNNLI